MTATATVLFVDLTDSTGIFELLGDEKASQTVTGLQQWIGEVCADHGGHVVKALGNGVFARFPHSQEALEAAIAMQRTHHQRIERLPEKLRMKLRVGVSSGEIVELAGDCDGDAVHVAARLGELAGAAQIWAADTTVAALPQDSGLCCRNLGPMALHGKAEPRAVYRVEWHEAVLSALLMMPGESQSVAPPQDVALGRIELSWLDTSTVFSSGQMPIHLGRVDAAQFVVNDRRVSRLHAKIEWVNATFVLTDLSSYGTWIRFEGTDTELALRRSSCVLHQNGEMTLGAPFSDYSAPAVCFQISRETERRSALVDGFVSHFRRRAGDPRP